MSCPAITKSKGKTCGRPSNKGTVYCGYHKPKSNRDGRKTPKSKTPNIAHVKLSSSKDKIEEKKDSISTTLDREGIVLLWRCLCGDLINSETIRINRRNILIGLGVPSNESYNSCSRCCSLMCDRCSRHQNHCYRCNEGIEIKEKPSPRVDLQNEDSASTSEAKSESSVDSSVSKASPPVPTPTEDNPTDPSPPMIKNNFTTGYGISSRTRRINH